MKLKHGWLILNMDIKKRCNRLLEAFVGSEHVDRWWKCKNRAFDMFTPEEVFRTEPEKVLKYLTNQIEAPY